MQGNPALNKGVVPPVYRTMIAVARHGRDIGGW